MIEEDLAGLTIQLGSTILDEKIIHILKRNLLDSFTGICASLQDQEMLTRFAAMVSSSDDTGMSVWGLDTKGLVAEAVFMNTILARRSDLLGTYISPDGMGANHPSDNTALVLCMAEWLNKSGNDLLQYLYTAYILSCTFSDYYNPEPAGFDHDAQAILYTPLIIGSILDLDHQQLIEAQRIAGVFGIDINQTAKGEITDWKHCTYASCALRALHIVKMARAGFAGANNIYQGESGVDHFIPHSANMGENLPDLESITFKRWPALVFCQTPIDVALDLTGRIKNPEEIEKIEVKSYKQAINNAAIPGAYNPSSRAGRTHSIPYCVATALIKKTIEYTFFNDDFAEKETTVKTLMEKITVMEDPDMSRKYPDGAPCSISITFHDGTVQTHRREYPKGDPHDPLSDAELEEKARNTFIHCMNESTADEIISIIWNIEKEVSMSRLCAPLIRNHIIGDKQ